MGERRETHAWRVRLRITNKAQLDLLTPALFEMDGISETWPKMEIIFSMTNYAIFMVACSLLPKPVDVTKLDVEIVNLKEELQRVRCEHMQPRSIKKLKIQPKET